jgi:hypothetical protein
MTESLFIRMGGQEFVWYIVSSPLIGVICIFGTVFFILRKIVRNESKSIEKSKLKDPIDFQTLEKLGKLRQEGILTDEEFQKQKKNIEVINYF